MQGGVHRPLVGETITLVEAKAGQTISSDMAASLEQIAKLFAGTKKTVAPVVIYGGPETQTRNGITYLAWHEIQNHLWTREVEG
jgi:hypothetical protein